MKPNFGERSQGEVPEHVMGELQPPWSCTIRSPPSANKAWNRRLMDWAFRDSRVYPSSPQSTPRRLARTLELPHDPQHQPPLPLGQPRYLAGRLPDRPVPQRLHELCVEHGLVPIQQVGGLHTEHAG